MEDKNHSESDATLVQPPPLIPTESPSSSSGGAGVVSSSSIKRNLRIQPVNVRDYAKYLKSKNRDALRHEWDVRIIIQIESICTVNGK